MSQTVSSIIEKNQEDLKKDAKIQELWVKNICDYDKHAKFKIKETYNFIIIGAGTAGCVLARELIHGIPNINILVLEAGGPNVHANSLISLHAYQLYDCDWGYVTQKQKMKSHVNPIKEVTVKKGIPYPHRKAAQGPEYKIWNWDHCLEAFKAIENNSQENSDEKFKKFHGFNGLLHVQDPQNEVYDIMSDLIDAAKNLEISYNDNFNSERQNGVGRYQMSLADGYLRDALKKVKFHPGSEPVAVDVRSYAHVLEIIWDKENKKENIATGIRYFCNGTVCEAFIAPKEEVIICSGAINSPQVKNMKFNNNALVIVHYYKPVK
ncbi:32807_t:CDS:2 [Gigaspora margarita]|uniref:32807_t:CDS:1 n=1 Tax=Gigaspora margarita TaxID=4874 RepID=A0ABN7UXH5_GIGMA|nr:32807_t:CDS:2 [Gigaspora margarita]